MNHFKDSLEYAIEGINAAIARGDKELVAESILQTFRDIYRLKHNAQPRVKLLGIVDDLGLSVSDEDCDLLVQLENVSRKRKKYLELAESLDMTQCARISGYLSDALSGL